MEIKGDDFLKKDQLNQENIEENQSFYDLNDTNTVIEEEEYSDIMLKNEEENGKNKKKYLVMGLLLIILFLLTVIIFRLLDKENPDSDNFTDEKLVPNKTSETGGNIEDKYQKLMEEKLKNFEEIEQEEPKTNNQSEALEEVKEEEEKEIIDPQLAFSNVKVKEVMVKEKEPVVQKVEPIKVVEEKSVTITKVEETTPNGIYVQIGAFSKKPNTKYLENIINKGFKYNVYETSSGSKTLHKVLIGPYKNRNEAKMASENIKKKLNISGTFIKSF